MNVNMDEMGLKDSLLHKENIPQQEQEINTTRNSWTQFVSLIRKNFLLLWRRKLSSFCELIVPVFIMCILVLIRVAVTKTHADVDLHAGDAQYLPHSQILLQLSKDLQFDNQIIMVGPESSAFAHSLQEDLFKHLHQLNSNLTPDRVVMIKNNGALTDYITNPKYPNGEDFKWVKAGIIIESGSLDSDDDWDITIRMNATGVFPDVPFTTLPAVNVLQVEFDDTYSSEYYLNGFLGLQDFVQQKILRDENVATQDEFDNTSIWLRPFPTPAYTLDTFAEIFKDYLGLFLTIAYLWPTTRIIKAMVTEKETRMRELMKIMGLSETALFMSWLVTYLIIFAFQSALITLATQGTVFKYSNGFLIFVFFYLFGISVFSFAFMVSSFFSNARTASTFGAIIFFLTFFASFSLSDSSPLSDKLAASLIPTICASQTAAPIFDLEGASIGAQWSNIGETYDTYQVRYGLMFLLLDTLIFILIGFYVNEVFPGDYGVPKPWYFLFQRSFWFPRDSETTFDHEIDEATIHKDNSKFEKVDHSDKTIGIKMRNLRKEFQREGQSTLIAVDDLNLDIYENQVLSLLGHNGAGKTTALNVLTGMTIPSGGGALMYGKSIATEIDSIRKNVGVCPQHDVLFDLLTVEEHLCFFSSLKGVPKTQIKIEVEKMIAVVGLTEKAKSTVNSLSGGQKRKLSVGIAFIGGSKIVILDEPTSGMDPYSRRSTWDLIRNYKNGRTIVLTTHFMDEADYLGDRIVIMASGRIVCCGSSLFLKQSYGVGYTMTVAKTKDSTKPIIKNLIQLVKEHVAEADVLSNIADEITFRLPFSQSSVFPELFEILEADSASAGSKYGVESFGISVTTLEEVFLRAGDNSLLDQEEIARNREMSARLSIERSESQVAQDKGLIDGHSSIEPAKENLWLKHLFALLIKRWDDAKRDRKTLFWQVLYPAILMVAGISLIKYATQHSYPKFALSVENQYDNPDRISYAISPDSYFNYTTIMEPGNFEFPSVPIGCSPFSLDECNFSGDEFAEYLLNNHDYKQSKYGAFLFWNESDIMYDPPLSNTTYQLFYNTTGIHSLPTYLNVFDSARLKDATGKSINLFSYIYPLTSSQKTVSNSVLALIIGIAFAFIPASFGAFVVKERTSKTKHQQLISGVSITAYWTSNFVWDYLNFFIPALMLVALTFAFSITSLTGENLLPTLLATLLYGLSVTPFTYFICQLVFKDKSAAQNTLLILYIISGTILLIASIVMMLFSSTRDVNKKLLYLYRLFPNYAFAESISNLMTRDSLLFFPDSPGPWDQDVTGTPCIYMACECVVYFFLTLFVEWLHNSRGMNILQYITNALHFREYSRLQKENTVDTDLDVLAEKKRVESGQASNDAIVVQDIQKIYPGGYTNGAKFAVRGLSFGIPKGQCFGFLGLNGAGKTTTIKMMTLDEAPTSGTAKLNGIDIQNDRDSVRHLLGYCPQFDALLENLTAREQLRLYASIKGVSSSKVDYFVSDLIEQLGLQQYADLPCGGYSGGNKRKLSVGIALIGDPPIVFLDEPSTGMDPKSRRGMWNLISSTMKGRSVILTTHSMEECEALCSNIGIMVGGSLRCIGSAQRLKNRFGNGFQLDVNIPKKSQRAFNEFMVSKFPSCTLVEVQDHLMKFMIPREQNHLSEMFRTIEEVQASLDILEYSLSETSLEQIFIHFAREQEEEKGIAQGFRVVDIAADQQ